MRKKENKELIKKKNKEFLLSLLLIVVGLLMIHRGWVMHGDTFQTFFTTTYTRIASSVLLLEYAGAVLSTIGFCGFVILFKNITFPTRAEAKIRYIEE